jgi:hypothetical protein
MQPYDSSLILARKGEMGKIFHDMPEKLYSPNTKTIEEFIVSATNNNRPQERFNHHQRDYVISVIPVPTSFLSAEWCSKLKVRVVCIPCTHWWGRPRSAIIYGGKEGRG